MSQRPVSGTTSAVLAAAAQLADVRVTANDGGLLALCTDPGFGRLVPMSEPQEQQAGATLRVVGLQASISIRNYMARHHL